MQCFRSIKVFRGFPCTHRQWRARSHCRFVHGYEREFEFEFACHQLTPEMWVMDFGGLKAVRSWLVNYFDHTFLAAEDDPHLPLFRQWEQKGIIQLRVLPNPGMEGTAQFIYLHVEPIIRRETGGRVWIERVEVKESQHNSAIFYPSLSPGSPGGEGGD